jgi:uncharacterized membrane protein YtjA (UPF0391 family)
MLSWALTFLVLGLIAALLGFTSIAGASIGIAKILFFVFIAIFAVMLLMGASRRDPLRSREARVPHLFRSPINVNSGNT